MDAVGQARWWQRLGPNGQQVVLEGDRTRYLRSQQCSSAWYGDGLAPSKDGVDVWMAKCDSRTSVSEDVVPAGMCEDER